MNRRCSDRDSPATRGVLTRTRRGGLLVFAAAVTLAGQALAQGQGPLAVVVGRTSQLAGLTAEDLRRLYLGSTTMLQDKTRVILVEYHSDRDRFYRASLGMSEDRVTRLWIRRVFAGEAGSPPEEFRDPTELTRYVATHLGAIAFVPADQVSTEVRVVPIDGRMPGEAGYLLR